MNEIVKENNIENMIYEIRGVQVMLDSDLAKLYEVETKRINEAVRRNKAKFPEKISWILIENEIDILWSQNATANISTMSRTKPRVFTEQGVYMLATILKSKVATKVSIEIMDTFVKMRHFLIENKDIYKSINNINLKLISHDEKLDYLFSKFNHKEDIYFNGQIYDAYSRVLDIFNEAKSELIIIDSYADKSVLDMISKLKVKVLLITKDSNRINILDIEKYNSQYNNLTIIRNSSFHDRYFIIDNKEIYHFGTSINSMGNGIFLINKLEDKFVKETLFDKINNLGK